MTLDVRGRPVAKQQQVEGKPMKEQPKAPVAEGKQAAHDDLSPAWRDFAGQPGPTTSTQATKRTQGVDLRAKPSVAVSIETPVRGVKMSSVGDRHRVTLDKSTPIDAKLTLLVDGHKVTVTRDQEWDGFIVDAKKAATWPSSGPLPFEFLGVDMPKGYELKWESTSSNPKTSQSFFQITKSADE